ncbi:MAG: LON peptidase substrate-binding domain-containing protein [Xanthomonadales bacterium]|nr:LON peptidase substrate-binding domain-containing protein [Xanthomonadales bacterium]
MGRPEQHLPIFPLNTVLFPGGPLSLRVFEPRYLDMVKECTREDTEFGVCLILHGAEAGSAAAPVGLGTTARIVDFFTMEDGLLGIRATGVQRFRLGSTWVRDNGLLMAEVEMLAPPAATPLDTRYLLLRTLLERLLENVAEHYPHAGQQELGDSDWVACRLSELLPLELDVKQQLLETDDPQERLDQLIELVPTLQSD